LCSFSWGFAFLNSIFFMNIQGAIFLTYNDMPMATIHTMILRIYVNFSKSKGFTSSVCAPDSIYRRGEQFHWIEKDKEHVPVLPDMKCFQPPTFAFQAQICLSLSTIMQNAYLNSLYRLEIFINAARELKRLS